MNLRSPRWVAGWALVAMLVIAAAGWRAVPEVIRHQVNARLNAIPGYGGRVGWVSVDYRHRSYTLHDFMVMKRNGRVHWPYFFAPAIEVAVRWRSGQSGGFYGEVRAPAANITFVQGADAERSQLDLDARWTRAAHAVFPLPIAKLEIENGHLLYLDDCHQPNLAFALTDLHLLARDQIPTHASPWTASIEVGGCCVGQGRFQAVVLSEPGSLQPHFTFHAEVHDVSLPALNDLLVAYADVGLTGGTLGLQMKIDGHGGRFDGYLKPSFDHLAFARMSGSGLRLGNAIVGTFAAAAANLMRRQVEQRLDDQIPITGSFSADQNDFLAAFKAVARAGSRISVTPALAVTSQ